MTVDRCWKVTVHCMCVQSLEQRSPTPKPRAPNRYGSVGHFRNWAAKRELIPYMTSVLFISKSGRYFICLNYPILCYICLESLHQRVLQPERTLPTALLVFIIMIRKHHSFHAVLSCCIYPPHLKRRSLKMLSHIKAVSGAKKVEDRCSRTSEEK